MEERELELKVEKHSSKTSLFQEQQQKKQQILMRGVSSHENWICGPIGVLRGFGSCSFTCSYPG